VAIPAVGVRVLAAFLLGACLLGCTSKACTLAGVAPCCVTVRFDLRQLLATVPVDVQVWACVDEKCVRHFASEYPLGSSNRTTVEVSDYGDGAGNYDSEVDARVIVRDHGRVVFDTTRQLELDVSRPNGPGCDPAVFDGDVLATPEGDLIQQ
jgi:hypothetical protein